MTHATHTPGTWLFDEDHINVVTESGQTVACRPGYSSLHSGSEESDMRLIAAAPDLLDDLQHAIAFIEKHVNPTRDLKYNTAPARAAIAKATAE